jgi:basic membrane protein A and related proteins
MVFHPFLREFHMKTGTSAKICILAAMTVAMLGGTAIAQDFKPAIVFDRGGKFDKSFNEAAYTGIEKMKKETGVEYRDFEITNDAQREQAMQRFARDGHNPVVVIGFSFGTALEKVAKEFPNTRFTIIDSVVKEPNVRSAVFTEHEGSYLVGMMAALASKTDKVGFIGGMDIPLIRKFACGYVQGVKAAKPGAEVIQNMTGNTGAAFNDPAKGAELAKSQLDRGADVVYHAAGGTGIGVLRTVADAGKLGIGVDSNQNGLHPGKVLTSMLKRVDVAVYSSLMDAKAGKWTPGVSVYGLAQEGVGYALDDNNKALVSDAMKMAVDKAAGEIKAGTVKVHDYMATSSCPVS